jgi:hypothetical protein
MKTFKKHLVKELKNEKFKIVYEQEKELLGISVKIFEKRNKRGLTQKGLDQKANITQQQLSKI